MFLPAAAACMAWWSGATSPRTKRMSARGNDRRDRWQRRVSLRSLSVEYSAPPSRLQVGRGLPACTQCGFPGERMRCRKLLAARRTSPARSRWAKCPQSLSVTGVAWGTGCAMCRRCREGDDDHGCMGRSGPAPGLTHHVSIVGRDLEVVAERIGEVHRPRPRVIDYSSGTGTLLESELC
jgi:hypothetical protein